MSTPFVDLKAQYRRLEAEIRTGIDTVLEHGQFIMGPEVSEFEAALGKFIGVEHVVSCSSGTDALLLPLMAWNIGPGDAVFTTPFTFVATAEVISLLGATPVFVDIDPSTYNICPAALEEAVLAVKARGVLRARCVIPVDLFGLPCEYSELDEIAKRHDLLMLEDAAQATGGSYRGAMAGSFGHAAATSFFPAKPLGAYGDGGAVFTDDAELAERLRSIRVHGQGTTKYDNVRVGVNGRLDTLQAAILLPKLRALPGEIEARARVAARYNDALNGVVGVPVTPNQCSSAWAQYSVVSDVREAIRESLSADGVPTAVYYAKPLHTQTAYANLGYAPNDFPVSASASERIFSLPMYPDMSDDVQSTIIDSVLRATKGTA